MNTNFQEFYLHLSQDSNILDPNKIDDWLAEEICQSSIVSNGPSLQFLYSPPISPSSTSTATTMATNKSTVPLFPEIQQKKPTLDGTNNSAFPKIAPRPIQHPPFKSMTMVQKPKRPLSNQERDEILLKRQKNTDAARRSRLKKLMKMEQLEQQVSGLESTKQTLTTRVAVLESEKICLESKSVFHENRIKILEKQLAEAHKALTIIK